MYPLKFEPIFKERIWGGHKLGDVLGKSIKSDSTGESWEVSAVPGDVSVVANGPLSGSSLQDLIDDHAINLLGKKIVQRFGKEFPILIKFIDANQDLSIQVHPNDFLAKKNHDSFGKTEMWYVMAADANAKLIIGFKKKVTKLEYTKSIQENTLLDLLNFEEVKEGDTFFINSGKIHAIGAGVLLAEIQQTSDITYRVFDFNRKDKDGNYRELHTERALEAIDFETRDDFRVNYTKVRNTVNQMVESPYFITGFIELSNDLKIDLSKRDAFTIYMCVNGNVTLENDFGSVQMNKGETTLVSANSTYIVLKSKGARILEVTI